MRKGLVIGGGVLAAIVIVVVVVLVVVLASVDSIVEAAIERVGSDVTKTDVTVDGVSISTSSGTGTISGLVVGHPEGFDERVIRVGEARIVLDLGTLTSNTIVIKEISVTAPEVIVEVNESGTNVSRLQQTLSQGNDGGDDTASASDGDPEDGKKIVIERLTVAEGRVDLKAPRLSQSVGADLPSITLHDIGKDDGGATPEEVARVIVAAVSAAAGQAAIQAGMMEKLEGTLGEKAKTLLEQGSGGIRNLLNR